MADEVIIVEYTRPLVGQGSSVGGKVVTTQVLDIGTLSAQMNSETDFIVVHSKGTGFWMKHGGSAVSAAADTDGNIWVEAGTRADPLPVSSGLDYIDTAADS